jgi:hypothetical protein
MRATLLDRLPVVSYILGLVVAGRLLGPDAHPLMAALVPASVVLLGLVLPISPVWVRRSLIMLAGGTFTLAAASGALFTAGGVAMAGSVRWLMVLVPAMYLLYLAVGLEVPRKAHFAALATDWAGRLVVAGLLVWVSLGAVVAADAFTGTPPTANDAVWLAGGGLALMVAGAIARALGEGRRARRARRASPS